MLALLDGDIMLYRTAASAERENINIAKARLDELLDNIMEKSGADNYRFILSSPTNFRYSIYPEYKGNRADMQRPQHLPELKEYALSNLQAEIAPEGLEADDVMAMNQTEDSVICSLDKDMLQVSGKHFSWAIEGGTKENRWTKPDVFRVVSEEEALFNLYYQILLGDPTDNIKGVKGVGKQKAKKLLSECKTEKDYIDVCLSQYSCEEEFLMNAGCVYLLRYEGDSYVERYKKVIGEQNDTKA